MEKHSKVKFFGQLIFATTATQQTTLNSTKMVAERGCC
jgi:hypothetical protein